MARTRSTTLNSVNAFAVKTPRENSVSGYGIYQELPRTQETFQLPERI
jgi:hypothetical protein